jgi:NAD(P)-dependent dehydrogenase (short-subunit alcohol dehydrogenase family)
MWRLDGKVAVVTGAGGVLAGCMANGLAVAGADIAVLDVNEENALQRAKEIGKLGRRALAVKADVGDKGQLQRAADEIEAKLGPVDILINGAGTNSSTPFFEITEEEYDRILRINLKGAFLACQVFGQRMADRGQGGSIINISSASSGIPLSRVFTYSVSKAGINSLTQYLAREFAPYRIRVNAIAPGFFPAEQNRKILTPDRVENIMRHTPMGRFGEPEELLGATVWLASEAAASFVTGAIIRVDGGIEI